MINSIARRFPFGVTLTELLAVLLIPSVVTVSVPSWVSANAESVASSVLCDISLRVVVPIWLLGGVFFFWRQVRGLRLLERLVRFAAPAAVRVS